MSQTVWIARHANRLDFVNPEWFATADRPYDPPLSEDGFEQAGRLARRLAAETKIQHIFCSPFLRTVQTAAKVAKALELPLKLEWGLCEWLNPAWMPEMPETLPVATLAKLFPAIDPHYTSLVSPTYPELEADVDRRTAEIARKIVDRYAEDVLLVGHGASVFGAARGLVAGANVRASLCCLVQIVRDGDRWCMLLNGDTSHLEGTEEELRFV